MAYENEVIKPMYEIKGFSKIIIPRTAEEKPSYYWIKPSRGKGVHINISKSVAKSVKSEYKHFECWLPDDYINENHLQSYVENQSL